MRDEHRTYNMTGRPPVRIKVDEWSSLTGCWASWHDGEAGSQATRASAGWIEVLRHYADGRVLVVGSLRYKSTLGDAPDEGRCAGILLSAEQATTQGIVAAIEKLELVDVPHISVAALKRKAVGAFPVEEL